MQYQQFVIQLSKALKYTPRETRNILNKIAHVITLNLSMGCDVSIQNLGKFINFPQAERVARDPRTGKRMVVPPSRRVKFKPALKMKKEVHKSTHLFRDKTPAEKYGGK